MPGARRCGKLPLVMDLRRTLLPLAALALALGPAACGGGDDRRPVARIDTPPLQEASAPGAATAATAPPDASRPTAPAGPTLVKLERLDGRFGRHDTLIVARDGHADLQLAHGGGGFRKAACTLGARSLRALRRDLRRLPIDGPERRVSGYEDVPEHADGVIIARPPVYAVTYRKRLQVFGGDTMPADGAPLAARFERILTAHEGRCHVTFHRP
jgi:hypothetical protein